MSFKKTFLKYLSKFLLDLFVIISIIKKKMFLVSLKVFQTIHTYWLSAMCYLSSKLHLFFCFIKNKLDLLYYRISKFLLELLKIVNNYILKFIKFLFYRNNKFSKLKIISILLMSIILSLLYNLYVWIGLEITLNDLFMLYFSMLLVFQAIICELPLFLINTLYKELVELALYIENGGPVFQASLLGLFFKLVSIFFFEGKPTPYQFFSEKIRQFFKKKD